jgi:hypothetical protein
MELGLSGWVAGFVPPKDGEAIVKEQGRPRPEDSQPEGAGVAAFGSGATTPESD